MPHATGRFDVQIKPVADAVAPAFASIGRMTVDKQFHGELEGSSAGLMLTSMGEVKGSAVYVVIERFEGTLHGKRGSFSLAHKGVMDRGVPLQNITVVPDSGTGELAGLRGTLTITIEEKVHNFDFDYSVD